MSIRPSSRPALAAALLAGCAALAVHAGGPAPAAAQPAAAPAAAQAAAARSAARPTTPHEWSEAIARSTMERIPDLRAVRQGHAWRYFIGFYMFAQDRVYDRTGDRRYLEYARRWADSVVDEGGRLHVPDAQLTKLDDLLPAIGLLSIYEATGDQRYARGATQARRRFDAFPRTADRGFWHKGGETQGELWLDGLYMGPAFLAEYARVMKDPSALDEAARQIRIYTKHLADPATGLMYHAYDEDRSAEWADRATGRSPVLWGRAMGWAMMGLVEVLDRMPASHPDRAALLGILRGLSASLARYQDPQTGAWWQVVDAPGRPGNWLEASSTAMFTYAIARAAEQGYLDRRFADVARRGYAGALTKVSLGADGRVEVKDISEGTNAGGSYEFYATRQRSMNDLHGLAAYILMFEQMGRRPAAAPAGATGAAAPRHADVIYRGGPVLTMDAAASTAEAVAVRDGRVLAVGRRAAVDALRGPGTRVVDLRGRTLAPGFIAAHDHLLNASLSALYHVDLNSPPIGTIETAAQLLAALRQRARAVPAGTWIVGRGYDDTLLREGRHPTRAELDSVSTDHPIWITHTSGHLSVGNSMALTLAGVTRETANARVRRDPATGEPTGLVEGGLARVNALMPRFTPAQRRAALARVDGAYLAKGVTTTAIAGGVDAGGLSDLASAQRDGALHLRVVTMAPWPQRESAETGDALAQADGTRLQLSAIKIWQDGSLQGYTGYLTRPYHRQPPGDTANRGRPERSREELVRMVVERHCKGYQLAVHANGDAAIDDVLTAYAAADSACPRRDTRHRIEHAQTPRPDQIRRMRELGVTPSVFVGHVYYWGDRHRDIFLGPERAARISPLRAMAAAGVRFSIHNDSPVTPVDPLLLVWAAVTRRTKDGAVLGPGERISPLLAMRAITSEAAWQNFVEDSRGSIEVGKLADFVVLSENPLAVAPARLREVRVLQTVVGGVSVYDRAPAPAGR